MRTNSCVVGCDQERCTPADSLFVYALRGWAQIKREYRYMGPRGKVGDAEEGVGDGQARSRVPSIALSLSASATLAEILAGGDPT
jgi:hypothetical protein